MATGGGLGIVGGLITHVFLADARFGKDEAILGFDKK
jgi:hypothetical protein